MTQMTTRAKRKSTTDRATQFEDLAGRINVAGIRELSKSDPQAAYMAAQQMEKELLKEQAQHQAQQAQQMADQSQELSQSHDGSDGLSLEEVKTEKGLELQVQLPFGKKQQLNSIQSLKMEIENQLRARQTPTPTPR